MVGNVGYDSRVCVCCRSRDRLCSSHPYSIAGFVPRGSGGRGVLSSGCRPQTWQICRGNGGCLESADVSQPGLHSDGFAAVGWGMSFVFRDGGLQELGGKALALLRLEQAGLPIPAWFAISPSAFTASLTKEQTEALASEQPERLNSALLS